MTQQTLKRSDLIEQLRYQCPHIFFKDVVLWPTEAISRLLDYWAEIDAEEEICEYCGGEGVVTGDYFDPDSHCWQQGAGYDEPCECTLDLDRISCVIDNFSEVVKEFELDHYKNNPVLLRSHIEMPAEIRVKYIL